MQWHEMCELWSFKDGGWILLLLEWAQAKWLHRMVYEQNATSKEVLHHKFYVRIFFFSLDL